MYIKVLKLAMWLTMVCDNVYTKWKMIGERLGYAIQTL